MTMYLEHFGLREAPFRITPHTEFFFAGANRGATLEALVYAITAGEGLVKVTGEVGTGKTMLSRVLMERLPETVVTLYLAVPSLTRDEMLVAISSELGIATDGASTTQLLRSLQQKLVELHAGGRQVVALIDEAHAMPLPTLEEIRLLSNLETGTEKLLQIVLFGQPELDAHLALPNMRQLKERITHAFLLDPLPARDIRDYINFRLRAAGYHGPDLFGPEALRIIAEASEGLTRRINIYADKTLLAAFAAGTHSVSADHARAAVSDTQIVVAQKSSSRPVAVAALAGLAAGVVLGFGGAQLLRPDATPVVAAAPVTTPAPKPDAAPKSDPAQPAEAPKPATAESATAAAAVAADPAPAKPDAATAARSDPAPAKPEPVAPKASDAVAKGAVTPAPDAAAKPVDAVPAKAGKPEAGGKSAASISARLEAGLGLLEGAAAGRYVVQLMMTDARERGYLDAYLAEAGRAIQAGELMLYPSGSADVPKVGVIWGAFASRKDAVQALEGLPASLRQFRPYVRPLEAVRSDVRRGAVS